MRFRSKSKTIDKNKKKKKKKTGFFESTEVKYRLHKKHIYKMKKFLQREKKKNIKINK